MSQVIKIKRGGISGLSGASTVQGELIIATGSLGNNVDGPFLLAHGDSLGLVAGAVFTGSSVPTITDSELNGILFYDDANSKFVRLDTNGNQSLDIQATGFSGDTDGVSEGATNLYYTDARVKTKLNAENVLSGSSANVLTFLNVEAGADVTDTANVTAAGALMDSEINDVTLIRTLSAASISGSFNADSASFETRIVANEGKTGYTDAAVKTKLDTENVVSGSASDVRSFLNVAEGATNYGDTNVKTKLNTEGVISGSAMSPTFAGLTVTGNASIQGTLTTVNSNDVSIGDRIITLNTADSAGDAGIQVHDTDGNQTGSLLWDTDGNYWKVGVVGGTDYRLVEWDGETAGGGDFISTDANGRISASATTTDGDLLFSNGDGTFTVTNVIDGGSY